MSLEQLRSSPNFDTAEGKRSNTTMNFHISKVSEFVQNNNFRKPGQIIPDKFLNKKNLLDRIEKIK